MNLLGLSSLTKKQRVLVACSGGMDSCVLVHMLYTSQIPFAIAHVNYHLRGAESAADEKFVKALAVKYKVPSHTLNAENSLKKVMQKHSLQEAARKIRYTWFNELIKTHGYTHLLTAHHANDQAETLLLHLFRGAGIKGLAGMKHKSGHHLRPLLSFTHKELKKYATQHKIKFRVDSSNKTDAYDRNYVRNKLIPVIEKKWPQVIARMSENSFTIQSELQLLEELVNNEFKKWVTRKKDVTEINLRPLVSYAQPAQLLYAWLHQYGFNGSQCVDVMEIASSTETRKFYSPGYVLTVKKNKAWLGIHTPNVKRDQTVRILKTTRHVTQPIGLHISYPKKPVISKTANRACIDLRTVTFPLTLRRWRPGDSFTPIGMRGRKKISDLLTDLKLPAHKKENTYVVCDKNKIIWVAGIRLDDRVKITSKTTRSLQIELKD